MISSLASAVPVTTRSEAVPDLRVMMPDVAVDALAGVVLPDSVSIAVTKSLSEVLTPNV